ncbi:MAG: DNA alkylation repair protein [Planctomycetota bacterium]
MKTTQALSKLKGFGTAQNRKIYARHGVSGPMFGVSYAHLGKLKKEIKLDQELAEGLWASGNHDARVLAAMIADPSAMKAGVLDAWCKEVDNHVLCDAVATVAAASPAAASCARRWRKSRDEWRSAAGWAVFGGIAADLPVAEVEEALATIEAKIQRSPNRTRHAMNQAVISIGLCSAALQRKAIASARRIGKVDVDHGETSCKTPDAEAYIKKTAAYRKARATAR